MSRLREPTARSVASAPKQVVRPIAPAKVDAPKVEKTAPVKKAKEKPMVKPKVNMQPKTGQTAKSVIRQPEKPISRVQSMPQRTPFTPQNKTYRLIIKEPYIE